MRRSACLGILTLAGVLATAATYEARQQEERADLEVQPVAENLYMLANASTVQGMGGGGNTAIFVMADGVALVDTKINGYGQDIIAHVAELTDKPITTVINTHTHFDHSGGNTELPDTVEFVVHENTRAQMARETCEPVTNCGAFKGANAKYLPRTTYSDRMSLFAGPDQIDLYHFGRGHTDGDTSSSSRRRVPCTPATCSSARACRSSTSPTATAAPPSSARRCGRRSPASRTSAR